MNTLLKHTVRQPFISATAFAALVHSTWSLGTLFAGQAPRLQFALLRSDTGAFVLDAFALAYWLLPALAIAFALDVGQVATAHDISSGKRNARKYATFVIFALATYYLQFVYMAHHMPALPLGDGVAYTGAVESIRNAALWIVPALLPASTMLYTFSHGDADAYAPPMRSNVTVEAPRIERKPVAAALHEPSVQEDDTQEVQAVDDNALESDVMRVRPSGSSSGSATGELSDTVHRNAAGSHTATCPHCDATFTKPTEQRARMSLTAHMRKHSNART